MSVLPGPNYPSDSFSHVFRSQILRRFTWGVDPGVLDELKGSGHMGTPESSYGHGLLRFRSAVTDSSTSFARKLSLNILLLRMVN